MSNFWKGISKAEVDALIDFHSTYGKESKMYDDGRNDIKSEGFRPVRFNFGGDGGPFDVVFNGYTDDSYWNGWLNVWITVDEYRNRVRPTMLPTESEQDDEYIQELDHMADEAEKYLAQFADHPCPESDPKGWVSLACCYTTCEVPCWLCGVETEIYESEACFDCYTWMEKTRYNIDSPELWRKLYVSHLYRINKKLMKLLEGK